MPVPATLPDYIADNIAGSFGAFSGAASVPSWVVNRANPPDIALDFSNNRAWQKASGLVSSAASLITVSRASVGTVNDSLGNWTSVNANLPRLSDLGLLVEEARTNSIRNNSMQGAVAGSPGTLPTNWGDATLPSGISRQIVSIGTQNGTDIIVIRYSGTAGASASINLQAETGAVTATTGQTWDFSSFVSMMVNSGVAPTPVGFEIDELDSGGSFLAGSQINLTFTSSFARYDATRLLNQATTARVRGYLRFAVTSGQVYDFTITVGWPQLELGASVTSPIRTTNAAVTRAADVVTLTAPPAFGSSFSMYAAGTPQSPVNYGPNQFLLHVDDGTNNNRVGFYRNGGAAANTDVVATAGGASYWNVILGGSNTQNTGTSAKYAAAVAASDQAGSSKGSSVVTNASGTPAIPTAVHFGATAAGTTSWNGFEEYSAIWASQRVPNAQLQSMTT